MTIKNDTWIKNSKVLSPCYDFTNKGDKGHNIISRGVSSYGYDLTCSNTFLVCRRDPTPCNLLLDVGAGTVIERHINLCFDPKKSSENNFIEHIGDYCLVPPGSFILAKSAEYIKMPKDVIGICVGKSTYARCGLIANTTPIEPEWEGHLVIELSNSSSIPVKVYANEGIVQVLFFDTDSKCEVSYKDRGGKYQKQTTIQTAKV